MAVKRRRWRGWQGFMDPARFVFLDETSTATNMARRYGRCPASERLVAAVPQGHWHTTTLIAGLRQGGITAPLVLDGPMTGAAFRACRPDQGGPLVHHRQADRHRPSQRVRQLSPQLRLWFYLKRRCSS